MIILKPQGIINLQHVTQTYLTTLGEGEGSPVSLVVELFSGKTETLYTHSDRRVVANLQRHLATFWVKMLSGAPVEKPQDRAFIVKDVLAEIQAKLNQKEGTGK